ncbi:unnamed protein product [Mesocestoides corti]|uniref:Musculoskeletal embryonic nuclear protein 1 n=1 Tax=Mesocestoides corti TaxID=53468 RepID=A0A0R3UJ02_MESCO|nr:unnamed protein product [Mesocestoides corti]
MLKKPGLRKKTDTEFRRSILSIQDVRKYSVVDPSTLKFVEAVCGTTEQGEGKLTIPMKAADVSAGGVPHNLSTSDELNSALVGKRTVIFNPDNFCLVK